MNKSTAKLNGDIDDIIIYEDFNYSGEMTFFEIFNKKKHGSFLNLLRDFKIVIDDTGYGFTSMACFLSRIPLRIGRNNQGFGFLYHFEFPYAPNKQLISRRLMLLEPFGVKKTVADIKTPYIIIEKANIEKIKTGIGLEGIEYFTVQPFAGWQAKNWGIENFINISREFAKISKMKAVFVGSPDDESLIAGKLSRLDPDIIDAAGMFEIDEVAALIAGAKIHVGGDSFAGHIAAAVGIKSLTVFGPTNPIISAYLGENNIAVVKKTDCRPKHGKIYCCYDAGRSCENLSCLGQLKTDMVLKSITDLWLGRQLPKVVVY